MAATGPDAALERALEAIDGVAAAHAAIAVDGLPGARALRVVLLVDDDGADAVGRVVRAARDALRSARPGMPASLALERLIGGVRHRVDARGALEAAPVAGAVAAGGEILLLAGNGP
jgi:hypothetical protein